MAVWGWARAVPLVLDEDAWPGLPNVERLLDEISARPAAAHHRREGPLHLQAEMEAGVATLHLGEGSSG
jgi:hypothetical protein